MSLSKEILVANAGMVLLNRYLPTLFKRLQFVSGINFTDQTARYKAVHSLHYISHDSFTAREPDLSLNKLLCGLSPDAILVPVANLRIEDELIIEGMLSTAIRSWPEIRSSRINAFRKNWLLRDGVLMEHENHWELKVESRGQDILLKNSSLSNAVIKYHWMDKPLQVIWNY